MVRARVLSSFLVTMAVLALIVGFSFHRDEARAQTSVPQVTTRVNYHPVATLADRDQLTVHVVNLGRDPDAAPEQFTVIFQDISGNLLQPESTCSIASGATCSVSFACAIGNGQDGTGACVVRATVVGEGMGCVTSDMGTGQWMTNLEILTAQNDRTILGAGGAVLQLPTDTCVPGPDAGVDSTISPDSMSPDTAVISPDSLVAPSTHH